MASLKQKRWYERSRILWRLKGIIIPFSGNVLTTVEIEKLTQAFSLIEEVIKDSTNSSIELGFNAKPRCEYCGKPLDSNNKCINSNCFKSDYGTRTM